MGLLRRLIGTASRFAGSRGRTTRTRPARRPVRRRRTSAGGPMGMVRRFLRRGGRARI